jgi:hypothetical protein
MTNPIHDGDCTRLLREDIAKRYLTEDMTLDMTELLGDQIVHTLRWWYQDLDFADYFYLCEADEAFHEGRDIPPRSPFLCHGCMDAIAELLHLLGSKPPSLGYGILNPESIP